jgi:MoaA/NifB/PqqE/SkfB family radical SAM enzyme
MYIQITTRCNMKCKHCKFSCSPTHGKDMPLDLFKYAVGLALDYDDHITIGGGEPTLHPDVLLMLGYVSMLYAEDLRPFMVTNGTCDKKTWKALVRAHEQESIQIAVSRDPWHDEDKIQPWVWEDADRLKLWWGNTGTRTIERGGRARRHIEKLESEAWDYGYERVRVEPLSECGPRVTPDGMVWADVPKKFGGGKIGPLDEETLGLAMEAISRADEEGVCSNPWHKA